MNFAHVSQGIINATRCLSSRTQINNIVVERSSKIVSWVARKPGIVKALYYPLEYQFLVDTHQYSLLLSDGSFFQFFYEFNSSDELLKARLAFYPRPLPTNDLVEQMLDAADQALDRDDEELFDHLYNWTELMELKNQNPSNTSHIRFDYDSNVTAHSPAHLQLSGLHEFRIPANYFPQPLAFVQLCEMTYANERELSATDLVFERQHALLLQPPTDLISLAWPALNSR